MWLSSADVRTKNGTSVNEPGFNWHLHRSFHSLSPIDEFNDYRIVLYKYRLYNDIVLFLREI